MPFVDVEGLRTFYESKGKGQPLLLIHGSACTHSIWRRQLDYFGQRCYVIAVDLMGHGKSEIAISPSQISIRQYMEFVNNFLEALNIQKATLIGHSLGGAISIEFCLNLPDKVECLGLVNTGAKLGVNPELLSMLRKDFRKALTAGLETILCKSEEADEIRRLITEEMLKTKPAVGLADFEACNRFDSRETLSQIRKPTLIIGGTEDLLTPRWFQRYLHQKIANSKLRTIDGVGHFPMIEKPEKFNAILFEFLEKYIGLPCYLQ